MDNFDLNCYFWIFFCVSLLEKNDISLNTIYAHRAHGRQFCCVSKNNDTYELVQNIWELTNVIIDL